MVYAAILLLAIVLVSVLFAAVLLWLRLFSDVPLSSGESAAYPPVQSTLGLAISAVASSVALVLALRSVQSSDKDRTIALLDIYLPEVSALVEEANALQDRLRDALLAMRKVAFAGSHLTVARLFHDYAATGQVSDGLKLVLDRRKTAMIEAFRKDYGVDPGPDLPEEIALDDDADDFLGEVLYDIPGFDRQDFEHDRRSGVAHGRFPHWQWYRDFMAEHFAMDRASADLHSALDQARQAFDAFCKDASSPRSGLMHRVLSRRFDELLAGPYAALPSHLARPAHPQFDGFARWPTPDLRARGYASIGDLPDLFPRFEPLAFTRTKDCADAVLSKARLPEGGFFKRLRSLEQSADRLRAGAAQPGPPNGADSPEALGACLGRFLPVISHFRTSRPISVIEMADPEFALRHADGPENGDQHSPQPEGRSHTLDLDPVAFSPAFFRLVDHFPDPKDAPAFSPVFVWIIPLLIRLISPLGVLQELSAAMADLDLDGDLLERHLRLQLLRLYTYEAFGDHGTSPQAVPAVQATTEAESSRASPNRLL
jgi:hypothetical protein